MDARLQALMLIDRALSSGGVSVEFELPETVACLDMLSRFVEDGCGLAMIQQSDGEMKRYKLTWGKEG